MNNLLKRAKQKRVKPTNGGTKVSKEHVVVALEFLKGNLTLTQASYGFSRKNASHGTYAISVRSIQKAYRDKKIKIL